MSRKKDRITLGVLENEVDDSLDARETCGVVWEMVCMTTGSHKPARFDGLELLLTHVVHEAECVDAYTMATKVKLG